MVNNSCQINSGKEPQYPFIKSGMGPKAIQDVLEKKKILVPTRIQTMDHQTSGTDTILTKLQGFRNVNLQQAMILALLPPGKKHCTHCTEGGVGLRATLTGAQNLVSTPGFNHQTAQPIMSYYTHVMKAYRPNSTLTSERDGHQWLILQPHH